MLSAFCLDPDTRAERNVPSERVRPGRGFIDRHNVSGETSVMLMTQPYR
jgi:hypothetical protein